MTATPTQPSWDTAWWVSWTVPATMEPRPEAWRRTPYVTSAAWLTMKARKIGVRTNTDSLIPRKLSRMSQPTTANSAGSFSACHWPGMVEKMASQPAATEMEMVRT